MPFAMFNIMNENMFHVVGQSLCKMQQVHFVQDQNGANKRSQNKREDSETERETSAQTEVSLF